MDDMIASRDMPVRFPGTTDASWAQHRYRGTGPKYVKVGRKVFYRVADLNEWLERHTMTRTDDRPAQRDRRLLDRRGRH